jgi:hypothetical protein
MGINCNMTKAHLVVSSSEIQVQHIPGPLLRISGNNENIGLITKCVSKTQFYELQIFQTWRYMLHNIFKFTVFGKRHNWWIMSDSTVPSKHFAKDSP